jgi:hypothetical protein
MAYKHPAYIQEFLGHASISITLVSCYQVFGAMDDAL